VSLSLFVTELYALMGFIAKRSAMHVLKRRGQKVAVKGLEVAERGRSSSAITMVAMPSACLTCPSQNLATLMLTVTVDSCASQGIAQSLQEGQMIAHLACHARMEHV
jgi:hypothetical protein